MYMLKVIYKPQVGLGAWMMEIMYLWEVKCKSKYQYHKRLPMLPIYNIYIVPLDIKGCIWHFLIQGDDMYVLFK